MPNHNCCLKKGSLQVFQSTQNHLCVLLVLTGMSFDALATVKADTNDTALAGTLIRYGDSSSQLAFATGDPRAVAENPSPPRSCDDICIIGCPFPRAYPTITQCNLAKTMAPAGLPSSMHLIQIGGLGSGLDFNE